MPERRLRVFLAHSNADKPSVREVARLLALDGFEPWLDEESLVPGQEWALEISRAIARSDTVAVFLSTASVSRAGYVNKEITQALDLADRNPEGTAFIVPVRLDDCALPDRLRHIHGLRLAISAGDFSIAATYGRLQAALVYRGQQLGLLNHDEVSEYSLRLPRSPELIRAKTATFWEPRYSAVGRYLVRGRNPDGRKYFGTATIDERDGMLALRATIGARILNYTEMPRGAVRFGHETLRFEGNGHRVEYEWVEHRCLLGHWGDDGVEELIAASPFAELGLPPGEQ
ncbi:toll/interleukin-1 receptor domain-containing protein [Nocardia sp. NPDC004068]|uniref:toll/interleukin-1 receptor domain-containing protein n=1 Tax=Nocardia sp. NPDC004068 TaxID=3364303 RepID=UPI0036D021DC